jgi:hypothetical protein
VSRFVLVVTVSTAIFWTERHFQYVLFLLQKPGELPVREASRSKADCPWRHGAHVLARLAVWQAGGCSALTVQVLWGLKPTSPSHRAHGRTVHAFSRHELKDCSTRGRFQRLQPQRPPVGSPWNVDHSGPKSKFYVYERWGSNGSQCHFIVSNNAE